MQRECGNVQQQVGEVQSCRRMVTLVAWWDRERRLVNFYKQTQRHGMSRG